MSRITCPDDLPVAPDFSAESRAADLAADALFAVPRYEHRVVTQEQLAEAIARAHLDHEIFCGKQRGAA